MMIIQLARPDFFYSLNSLSLPDNEVPHSRFLYSILQPTNKLLLYQFFLLQSCHVQSVLLWNACYSNIFTNDFSYSSLLIFIYSTGSGKSPDVNDCYRPWKPSIQETSACTRTNSSSIRHLVGLYHLSPWLIQVQVSQGKNIVLVYSNIQLLLTNISSKT